MKKLVALLLGWLPLSLFTLSAQTDREALRRAMDAYDYETVIKSVGTDCADTLALLTKVQAMKAMNRYQEAVGVLNSLLPSDSTDVQVLASLADCYRLSGVRPKAARCYAKVAELCPDNSYFRLQLIRSQLLAEDYEAACSSCHDWLERDTVSAMGYQLLGLAYEGQNDLFSAFSSFNLAYRRDSLDGQTVAHLAGILNDNQQYEDAVELTECFRLSDTTQIDVNRQNAKAHCLLKHYDKAIARYEALKQLGDRSFLTYYYLGISYYGADWFYGAYDNLKEANRKNPIDINTLYYLSKSALRTSWHKDGVEYMETALDLAIPKDSLLIRLYDGLAEGCERVGDHPKEIEALKKLYLYTKKNFTWYRIGRAYDRMKDGPNAIRYYTQYMESVPENQRYPLDEDGTMLKDRITFYQQAERRIKQINVDNFFQGNTP